MNGKTIPAALLIFTVTSISASPIELDTADAHIIVVRPIDQYGIGEQKISNRQLDRYEDKAYAFVYYYGDKKDRQYVKATDDENPIPVGVKAIAEKYGYTPNGGTLGNTGIENAINVPQMLTPEEAKTFTSTQNAVWSSKVIAMGDPSTLEDRASNAQNWTNFGAIASLLGGAVIGAYAGNAIGAPVNAGGGATIGGQLGISTSFVNAHGDLIGFNQLPNVDYSKYKSVDVRTTSIIRNQRSGNIIIAYKDEKTEQAEQAALIAAIPVLLGFNESVDQIKAARQQDLAARQKVWAECVTAGLAQCKGD